MQSTYYLIFSGCVGVTLVLASAVLMPPLLAVLVAAACVTAAWVHLRLDAGPSACPPQEHDDPGDDTAAGREGGER